MFNIPINTKPYYNTDQIANSIAADDMMDCYLEPVPDVGLVTRRRPGLSFFSDLNTGAPGDGIYEWVAAGKVIAVSHGRIFSLDSTGSFTDITGMGGTLNHNVPVVFSDGMDHNAVPWLYLANGKIVYSINGAPTITPSDGDTPNATHISWINEKFIGNRSGTDQFVFTDVDGSGFFNNAFWSGANNPVVCSAKGDLLTALFVAWQEVYAWGQLGIQVFQDDGVTPFLNIPGAFIEAGLEAPYSIAKLDNTLFGLCIVDGKRVVIRMNGRAPQVVSEPIARVLSDMSTVSDAIGDVISVGGLAIYLLQFPTEGQTWAYDFKNDTWCQWGYYNASTATHDAFLGQHSCFVRSWNKHLIMSRVDGKIYELKRSVYQDGSIPMVSYRRTGWIDHGNAWKRKRADQLYLKVKAKEVSTGTYNLYLRWRDNGNPVWSPYMALSLTPNYQGDCLIKLNRMGTYRSRQYEFMMSDPLDLVLVGGTETVTEMRN